jgi:hypothetical protein
MRRRSTLLLYLTLILSLAFSGTLSGILIPSPVATGTSDAPVVTPGAASTDLASRRVQRERRHDRKQENRQQDRKQKDRKADHKQKDKKHNRKTGRAAITSEVCTEAGAIWLPETQQCTHGPDPAPPGFNVDQPVQPLSQSAARRSAAAIACDGEDGVGGNRVQVLYVRESTTPSRYEKYLASFKAWSGHMDKIFQASAAETGGYRSVRFVQDPMSCEPVVTEVVVNPGSVNGFGSLNVQLWNQGYNNQDRLYLMFVDATTYCGVGDWYPDDELSDDNPSNFGPSYARVDAGCWSGDVAAHELMHNLGGVQDSAPNSSKGAHCVDEWDVMCYRDSPYYPTMKTICPDTALDYTRFDCGNNDYFHTNPSSTSYLFYHWNPANNQFLIGAGDITTPPNAPDETVEPEINWVSPVGNDQRYDASVGIIALQVAADDGGGTGVEEVEFWRYDNADKKWLLFEVDDTAASGVYESSIDVASLGPGGNWLSADAHDRAGNWTYELIQVVLPGGTVISEPPDDPPPATTNTTNTNDKKKHKKGKHKKNGHRQKKRR